MKICLYHCCVSANGGYFSNTVSVLRTLWCYLMHIQHCQTDHNLSGMTVSRLLQRYAVTQLKSIDTLKPDVLIKWTLFMEVVCVIHYSLYFLFCIHLSLRWFYTVYFRVDAQLKCVLFLSFIIIFNVLPS